MTVHDDTGGRLNWWYTYIYTYFVPKYLCYGEYKVKLFPRFYNLVVACEICPMTLFMSIGPPVWIIFQELTCDRVISSTNSCSHSYRNFVSIHSLKLKFWICWSVSVQNSERYTGLTFIKLRIWQKLYITCYCYHNIGKVFLFFFNLFILFVNIIESNHPSPVVSTQNISM